MGVMRDMQKDGGDSAGPNYRRGRRRETSTQCRPSRGHLCLFFFNNETMCGRLVQGNRGWWWWRWAAEPLIISWQDNNVPCCLLKKKKRKKNTFQGVQCAQGGADSVRRGNVVLYDCENCAVGPMNISLTRITSFNYFFCLIIPHKYYQKCCYACFCARG